MHTGLPISLDSLFNERGIEDNRIEYKAAWNEMTRPAVIETVCAFANDLLNLNGGYLVLGVAEKAGRAQLPPQGLTDPDHVQRKVFEACKTITPQYQPRMFVETYQNRPILVLWCPGGDLRPYQVRRGPQGEAFFVRQGSITHEARADVLRQLLDQTARVPFDDRACPQASLLDLSSHTVRSFLREIGSLLYEEQVPAEDLFNRMTLTRGQNGHTVPRYAALLFFCDTPERFLPGAHIEVARFSQEGDQTLEERVFAGPLPEQLRACLTYLEGQSATLVVTSPRDIRATRAVAYPPAALREAVVNAVYHRGYAEPRHPIKVYLYPDRISVTSYPGPHPAVRREHFGPGGTVPPGIPARNRRVGEFLKDLRLAEARGTGIPKISRVLHENGSPPPEFDFFSGEEEGYFTITLPIHPDHAHRLGMRLWREGHEDAAVALLQRAAARQPEHAPLTAQLIEARAGRGQLHAAREVLAAYRTATPLGGRDLLPVVVLARHLLEHQTLHSKSARAQTESAQEDILEIAQLLKELVAQSETLERDTSRELAQLLDQLGLVEERYLLIARAQQRHPRSTTLLIDLIQAKRALARRYEGEVREQLLCEALELLDLLAKKPSAPMARYFLPLGDEIRAELGLEVHEDPDAADET